MQARSDPAVPFDVVVIVASAGGLEAISRVVRDIHAATPVPIVVAQHLGGQGSQLVRILDRRLEHDVVWAEEGTVLRRGTVTVARPRTELEVLPDGTCALSELRGSTGDRPLDTLLVSTADSFAERTLAVVLTGMGRDGAAGTLAVRAAGGTVLVQDHETAEQPSMPRAVVEAGAADRVLPIHEIGRAVTDLAAGRGLPPRRADLAAERWLFSGGGEVARAARAVDWAATPLGPVGDWPSVLRTTLRLALEAPLPMYLLWGPDHVQLYNDAYRTIMGSRHPAGLGQPNEECWPEVWHLNAAIFARVLAGEAVEQREALYPITRHGALEDAWFDLFFSPVSDEQGVGGILCTVVERTGEVLAARRLRTLHALTEATAGASSWHGAFVEALDELARHGDDVPYALGYRLDEGRQTVSLVHAVGLDPADPRAQRRVVLGAGQPGWPVAAALEGDRPLLVDDVAARFGPPSPGREPADGPVYVAPLRHTGRDNASGLVVLAVPPRLRLDPEHEEFLRLLAAEVAVRLGVALAREKERERTDRLAELDRAKTEFFANVSHEFRTPLTLLLTPLEDALADPRLPAPLSADLVLVRRNARRLLRLVGSLLDFSRTEAGRQRAHFEPTDLARLTDDVAGLFRGAARRAGLTLVVDAPPLPEPVWIDAEMWEKILSNLLSNAVKFTHEGRVEVVVRALARHAEVRVTDTGAGIPLDEQPWVFQRFHRGRSTSARTQDGVGIGLALVDELVRRHHGRIRLRSEPGAGTTFTVWLPFGARPRAEGDGRDAAAPARPAQTAALLAEEAESWAAGEARGELPADVLDDPVDDDPSAAPAPTRAPDARVLVVDDNPDLRDYLRRLLAARWTVETASDGREALAAARARRPDVVLADVMMPEVDGLELLRRARADEQLATVPVVLVTARAGEEAAIEGLLAGADDYVVKPFSGRELLARLEAQIELARVREQAEGRLRAFVDASWDVVYLMGPDWTGMRVLRGRGFLAEADGPRGSWVGQYVPEDDRPRVEAAVRRAIDERAVFELEHRVLRPDGSIGWTSSRAVPLLDGAGGIVEWVGAAADVTARHTDGGG